MNVPNGAHLPTHTVFQNETSSTEPKLPLSKKI
jgi:hypothetical protein